MAILSMKDARIWVDNSGGTPVDVSPQGKTVNVKSDREISTYYTLDTANAKKSEGGKTETVDYTVYKSDTAAQASDLFDAWLVAGGTRTVQVDTPNSSSGSRRYSGEAYLKSYESVKAEAGKADPQELTASMEISGGLSYAAIP